MVEQGICLRCGGKMEYVGEQEFQLGGTGLFMGNLGNLLAGSTVMSVFACTDCGKLEFYRPMPPQERTIVCSSCQKEFSTKEERFIRCPHCGYYNP